MSLLTGLVGYWSLEEASGARADASGAGLTLTDNNTVTQAAGKVGNAGQFTAANSESLTQASTSLRFPTGDFTVSVWAYPDTLAGGAATYGRGIASFMTPDVQGDWSISIPIDGQVFCMHRKGAGADASGTHATASASLITLGTWAHIVFRYASGTYTVWVNGVSQGLNTAGNFGTGWSANNFSLGRQYSAGGTQYYWNGRIDEPGVWSRALSDVEIGLLYNGGSGRAYPLDVFVTGALSVSSALAASARRARLGSAALGLASALSAGGRAGRGGSGALALRSALQASGVRQPNALLVIDETLTAAGIINESFTV